MIPGQESRILCVVNKDEDPDHPGLFLSNYTSFRVIGQGQLISIPNSTVDDDLGSDPSSGWPPPPRP